MLAAPHHPYGELPFDPEKRALEHDLEAAGKYYEHFANQHKIPTVDEFQEAREWIQKTVDDNQLDKDGNVISVDNSIILPAERVERILHYYSYANWVLGKNEVSLLRSMAADTDDKSVIDKIPGSISEQIQPTLQHLSTDDMAEKGRMLKNDVRGILAIDNFIRTVDPDVESTSDREVASWDSQNGSRLSGLSRTVYSLQDQGLWSIKSIDQLFDTEAKSIEHPNPRRFINSKGKVLLHHYGMLDKSPVDPSARLIHKLLMDGGSSRKNSFESRRNKQYRTNQESKLPQALRQLLSDKQLLNEQLTILGQDREAKKYSTIYNKLLAPFTIDRTTINIPKLLKRQYTPKHPASQAELVIDEHRRNKWAHQVIGIASKEAKSLNHDREALGRVEQITQFVHDADSVLMRLAEVAVDKSSISLSSAQRISHSKSPIETKKLLSALESSGIIEQSDDKVQWNTTVTAEEFHSVLNYESRQQDKAPNEPATTAETRSQRAARLKRERLAAKKSS